MLDEVIGSYKLVSNPKYLHYDEIYIPDIKKSAFYDKKAFVYGELDLTDIEIKLRKYSGDDRYYDFDAGNLVYDKLKKTFVGYERVNNSELTIKDLYKSDGISLSSFGIDINGYYHDGYHKALKEPSDILESINGPWVEMVVYDDNKYFLKYYNGEIYKGILDITDVFFDDSILINLDKEFNGKVEYNLKTKRFEFSNAECGVFGGKHYNLSKIKKEELNLITDDDLK